MKKSILFLFVFLFGNLYFTLNAHANSEWLPNEKYRYTYKVQESDSSQSNSVTFKYNTFGTYKKWWSIKLHGVTLSHLKQITNSKYDLYFKAHIVTDFDETQIDETPEIPINPKKGKHGIMKKIYYENGLKNIAEIQYDILSTNAKVKTPAKTFNNVIKIKYINKRENTITISYFVKNYGQIKKDSWINGKYKNVVLLTKIN